MQTPTFKNFKTHLIIYKSYQTRNRNKIPYSDQRLPTKNLQKTLFLMYKTGMGKQEQASEGAANSRAWLQLKFT